MSIGAVGGDLDEASVAAGLRPRRRRSSAISASMTIRSKAAGLMEARSRLETGASQLNLRWSGGVLLFVQLQTFFTCPSINSGY